MRQVCIRFDQSNVERLGKVTRTILALLSSKDLGYLISEAEVRPSDTGLEGIYVSPDPLLLASLPFFTLLCENFHKYGYDELSIPENTAIYAACAAEALMIKVDLSTHNQVEYSIADRIVREEKYFGIADLMNDLNWLIEVLTPSI